MSYQSQNKNLDGSDYMSTLINTLATADINSISTPQITSLQNAVAVLQTSSSTLSANTNYISVDSSGNTVISSVLKIPSIIFSGDSSIQSTAYTTAKDLALTNATSNIATIQSNLSNYSTTSSLSNYGGLSSTNTWSGASNTFSNAIILNGGLSVYNGASLQNISSATLFYLNGLTSNIQSQFALAPKLASSNGYTGINTFLSPATFASTVSMNGNMILMGQITANLVAISAVNLSYIGGLTSNCQTQLTNLSTQISALPSLSSINVWSGANTFSSTITLTGNISANSATITPAQLGYLSGATSNLQSQISALPSLSSINVWSGANTFSSTLTLTGNLSANSATITPAQLGYLSGATSNLQTQLTTLTSQIALCASTSSLSSYVLSSALTTTLAGYITSTQLTASLASYVSSTSLSTTLASYPTNTSLTTTLSLYPTLAGSNTFSGACIHSGATTFNSTISVGATSTLTLLGNISANSATITPAQLGYLSGATSNLQTQLTTISSSLSNYVLSSALTTQLALYTTSANLTTQLALYPTLAGTNTFSGTTNTFTNAVVHNGSTTFNSSVSISASNNFTLSGTLVVSSTNITPSNLSMLYGVSSNIQTQLNTINTSISALPTLSASNTWSGVNNFNNTVNISTGNLVGSNNSLNGFLNIGTASGSVSSSGGFYASQSNSVINLGLPAILTSTTNTKISNNLVFQNASQGITFQDGTSLTSTSNLITSTSLASSLSSYVSSSTLTSSLIPYANVNNNNIFNGINAFNTLNMTGTMNISGSIVANSTTITPTILSYISSLSSNAQTQISAISSSLSSYVSTSSLTTTLSSYVLTASLSSYAQTSSPVFTTQITTPLINLGTGTISQTSSQLGYSISFLSGPTTLTANTSVYPNSMTLTTGVWAINYQIAFNSSTSATYSNWIVGFSTNGTSLNLSTYDNRGSVSETTTASFGVNKTFSIIYRASTSQTLYLGCQVNTISGTLLLFVNGTATRIA